MKPVGSVEFRTKSRRTARTNRNEIGPMLAVCGILLPSQRSPIGSTEVDVMSRTSRTGRTGRPIQRRTISQWKKEPCRIRRIIEAVELDGAHDPLLTAEAVSRLNVGALALECW